MSVYNQPRKRVIQLIILGMVSLIVMRLFFLQVVETKYSKLADANAHLRKVIYPSRGIIYDRNGRAVLRNEALYDLMVTPANVKKIDTAYLCEILQIDMEEFRKRITRAINKEGRVRPSVFASLLPQDMYGKLQESMYMFQPGFELVLRPVRSYTYGVGASFLGYISEIPPSLLADSLGRWSAYQQGDYLGRTGLENTYESILMGQRGIQYLVKDNLNRPQGSLENGEFDTAAVAGKNLRLALDIELQVLGERMMQGKVGSIVAIDPKTGGILTMVSGPTFDPNLLSGSYRGQNFNKLYQDTSSPLYNRAIQAMYPPGSTFKPITGLIALDEGVITPAFGYPCRGGYAQCGRFIRCTHSNPGHAANMRTAMANSCNAYFMHLYRLSVDNAKWGGTLKGQAKWVEYLNTMGFGVRLGVDIPSEARGIVPDTGRMNYRYRGQWNSCSEVYVGMGQGLLGVTPLQLANAMCILANRGHYYLPHFVESIDGDRSDILKKYKEKHSVAHISDEAFNSVVLGMEDVVTHGTARGAQIAGVAVCGKTGTAENKARINGKIVQLKDHSLFVGFAPKDDPKIAIAVVVENAGFGSTYAVPIASILMEKYLTDTISAKRMPILQRMMETVTMSPEMRAKSKLDSLNKVNYSTAQGDDLLRKIIAN
ncbi:penicillin-binding protein 2 [Chitinophaga alhagiae]|uniref:Penicillin-binding protein 2 n=1 Tax=Chitinophaga alhagiae TaxID=2203219 RepID=A0ABN5LUN6_9BACT|nr:penicillin-binding protein 2 [Chitinophaga alhagiae]AWO01898.1 penicillin-binding protein 2 [Chitinophaga alhagiae]